MLDISRSLALLAATLTDIHGARVSDMRQVHAMLGRVYAFLRKIDTDNGRNYEASALKK